MKTTKQVLFLLIFASTCILTSCSKDGDNLTDIKPDLEIKTVNDLDGSEGSVYFSLSSGLKVTGSDIENNEWDIKFSTTTISFNAEKSVGAQFKQGTLESIVEAPESGYISDDIKGSGSWYNYTAMTPPMHAILAIPGKILLIKTRDGKYAKLEIISYYKGNPDTSSPTFADTETRSAASYYTFKYAYQADGTTNLK